MNASLISGLDSPFGLALSNGKLFVVNNVSGTIGEYDAATGATINSALVLGLVDPRDIALRGGHLFVSENGSDDLINFVGEYDAATGAPINPTLIFTSGAPRGVAFVGGNVLVSLTFGDAISLFTISGDPINETFVNQGLSGPEHIVVAGEVSETGPGPFVFAAVLLSMHFLGRRIVVG